MNMNVTRTKKQVVDGPLCPRRSLSPVYLFAFLLAGIALAACLISGCGQTALDQAKSAGLASKQTAEAAYLTVYTEYLLGHVDEATVDRARVLYARWVLAQSAYVAALRLWETGQSPADLPALKAQITGLAAELHALASNAERQPTTQPAE